MRVESPTEEAVSSMGEIEFRVDITRTRLQEHFFNVFEFDSREELFAAIRDMEVGLDSIARSFDSRTSVYSGWVYWFLFLKGYLRFAETGQLESDNIYLDYLVRYYGPRDHDPGIAMELCQPELARERVTWRFGSMQQAASEAVDPGTWATDAVLVVVGDSPPTFPLYVYPMDSERPFAAALLDGWHRLFAARLWGVASLPGRVIHVANLEDAATQLALAGGR
jgi:hypothetical protein